MIEIAGEGNVGNLLLNAAERGGRTKLPQRINSLAQQLI
jgi:hypothetical protein